METIGYFTYVLFKDAVGGQEPREKERKCPYSEPNLTSTPILSLPTTKL